ncbi:MAG: AMP-binding protein [Ahniella sp.]|nr:AMP-binding protein [Ahniella sp.]
MEAATFPLLGHADPSAIFAYHGDSAVSVSAYLADVARVAAGLGDASALINLCEDRYWFLVAMGAALSRHRTSLLPSSRAVDVVREVARTWPGARSIEDAEVAAAGADAVDTGIPRIDAGMTALIGFTSGSTGEPKPNAKTFASLRQSTAYNARALLKALGNPSEVPNIVATVPPQHMYGIELSVFLPLLAGFPVHSGRPLFPADIARALSEVPRPRVLVSTPVHLRALLESGIKWPELDLIVSATAPLDPTLAMAIEDATAAPLLELFGSTETCVIAYRRTAQESVWCLFDEVTVNPVEDGTWINAPWFIEPKLLQDHLMLVGAGQFELRGRNQDLVDIAGKRASLADLTLRLARLPGVVDAAYVLPDPETGARTIRLAALVVAPSRTAAELVAELRQGCDPAFLPRPLKLVDRLPRNETGKLRRADLLALLRTS